MSVCDRGWKNETKECPCMIVPKRAYHYCALGVYTQDDTMLSGFKEPDSCPYAPILKVLVEARGVHNFTGKEIKRHNVHYEEIKFWIRR